MTLDINIPFSLINTSVARVLLDVEPVPLTSNFHAHVQSMIRDLDDPNDIASKVKNHLTRYGRLGIPNNAQIAKRFNVTESDAASAVEILSDKLKDLGF